MPSPFEGMTREEADKTFIRIGEEHRIKYEESFRKLQEEIPNYDPVYILAVNSFYSTFDTNVAASRRSDRKRILQYQVVGVLRS
jgi:hypothetical protein